MQNTECLNKQRVAYIDCIKGFAILLVVVGHVLSWQLYDVFYQIVNTPGSAPLLGLWYVINSFHMPLFMFASGLVFFRTRDFYKREGLVRITLKKTRSLLIPYFFMGSIFFYISGNFGYWYLWTLFIFSIISSWIAFFSTRLKEGWEWIENILLLFIAFLFIVLDVRFKSMEHLPFVDLEHFKLFIFFVLGYLCTKYSVLKKICSSEKSNLFEGLYFFSIIASVFMVANFAYEGPFSNITFLKNFKSIPYIAMFVLFFSKYMNCDSKIGLSLQYLGRHSLDIYLLHFFFAIKTPLLGKFYTSLLKYEYSGASSVFVVQIISSVLTSLVIILLCLSVSAIVSRSKILNFLMFGKKHS